MRPVLIAPAAIALVALGLGTATAKPFKGAQYIKQASVTLATARATALKARPGEVTDEELEKEKGGSGLRYSFDITASPKKYEVGVDAKTGTILENKAEGANPD